MYSDDVTGIGLGNGLTVLSKETLRCGEIDGLLHAAVAHLHTLLEGARAHANESHTISNTN